MNAIAVFFLSAALAVAAIPPATAMNTTSDKTGGASEGRLAARPGQDAPVLERSPGLHRLGIGGRRDGLVYVPSKLDPSRPPPLVLLLHGAGGTGENVMGLLSAHAEQDGFVVIAPDSRRQTWDIILGEYGPDVAFIDEALRRAFATYGVDPARVAVSGFSDGASYALSLGVMNGDLFTHILAYSPGFMAPMSVAGAPEIFISHGVGDQVLPVERCSRRLVPRLKQAGYAVDYHEFDGGHIVPPEMTRRSVQSFLR